MDRQGQMAKIAASISDYYDSLSEREMEEDRLWGAFAENQFPLEEAPYSARNTSAGSTVAARRDGR
jgi:hypothetical protein